MSSLLFAKHVSFEHSVSSPRPVITSRREKTTTTRPKFFSTQWTVSPLHAPSSARACCLHVLSELGRGAASFLATESTGTVLMPRLMTRIAGHGQAYLQLEMEDESKEYIVLHTHKGLSRLNRLGFGIASAPAIWQRSMDRLLQGFQTCNVSSTTL